MLFYEPSDLATYEGEREKNGGTVQATRIVRELPSMSKHLCYITCSPQTRRTQLTDHTTLGSYEEVGRSCHS